MTQLNLEVHSVAAMNPTHFSASLWFWKQKNILKESLPKDRIWRGTSVTHQKKENGAIGTCSPVAICCLCQFVASKFHPTSPEVANNNNEPTTSLRVQQLGSLPCLFGTLLGCPVRRWSVIRMRNYANAKGKSRVSWEVHFWGGTGANLSAETHKSPQPPALTSLILVLGMSAERTDCLSSVSKSVHAACATNSKSTISSRIHEDQAMMWKDFKNQMQWTKNSKEMANSQRKHTWTFKGVPIKP